MLNKHENEFAGMTYAPNKLDKKSTAEDDSD